MWTIDGRGLSSSRRNFLGREPVSAEGAVSGDASGNASGPVTAEDADNLFDWLSAGGDVYFDTERQSLIFGTRPIG